MGKKLLVLSDAVSASSGLARIARDLALRVHQNLSDVFDVASVGYGGTGSASIPFKEYHLHDVNNWLVPELPAIWNDFVGDEEGILFCIWDLSRLYWLGQPQTCPIPHLRKWVETAKMKKWVYGALDAEGPGGKLPHQIAETMKGFDRVLDYSAFSSKITGNPDHLPHGLDSKVFYPRDHKEAREALIKHGFQGLTPDSLLIGIVATNQARKNWQLGIETCRILLDRGHDVRLWAHTDVLDRYWSIGNLIVDYGLTGRAAVTNQRFTDEQLAQMYSACDVTLCIGPEGWGFPAMESLACGVPCIAGSYAAQAEFIPKSMQVDPIAYFHEGAFCSKRPVHEALKWAIRVEMNLGKKASLPSEFDWNGPTLWKNWGEWFLKGIE
jgi:glycosyltransferase involved in cell wall biosynthesis